MGQRMGRRRQPRQGIDGIEQQPHPDEVVVGLCWYSDLYSLTDCKHQFREAVAE